MSATYSMPKDIRATMTTSASRRLKALRQNEPRCSSRPYAIIYSTQHIAQHLDLGHVDMSRRFVVSRTSRLALL